MSKRVETMSDNLPTDVLIDILSRLPVKSLMRFTCVSKRLYSLITNPSFITEHLNRSLSSSNDNRLLLVRHYDMFKEIDRLALYFDNDSFDEYVELQCPFQSANDYFTILGSCNGLICLSDDYDTYADTIIIWNPSVKKSFILPKPKFLLPSKGNCVLGFGFDSLKNDYKVVRIVYQSNALVNGKDHNYSVPPNVEIYELSTGAWRSIRGDAPNYVIYNFFPLSTLTNGAVHWVASEKGNNGSFHNLIVAFDMVNEVFREIMMPYDLVKTEVLKLSMSLLGTSLALVQYEHIWQSDYCWVWVMKDYSVTESWARLFTIDMRGGIRKVVGFKKDNEVLLSARVKGLVSYDPNIRKIGYLGIHGANHSFYADTYVESLVLLDGNPKL